MTRRAPWAAAAVLLVLARYAFGGSAAAGETTIDPTAARFYAPETGGSAYPRFVFQRVLGFEARMAAMSDRGDGIGDGYGERDVREALDRHVAEEVLASLADRLIADAPPDKRPTAAELSQLERQVSGAFIERVGGRARIDEAARAEQLDAGEVDAILRRAALAAWYIDRAVTPILRPSEEQLRGVFRASANPYRGHRFEEIREALARWFVTERLRAAESAFLEGARSRIRVILTP